MAWDRIIELQVTVQEDDLVQEIMYSKNVVQDVIHYIGSQTAICRKHTRRLTRDIDTIIRNHMQCHVNANTCQSSELMGIRTCKIKCKIKNKKILIYIKWPTII
jgi:hypothetical protein